MAHEDTERVESPELHRYRMDARAWLAGNVPFRQDPPTRASADEREERQDEFRALQLKLYEAGYAGFTFPVEYGGQGLTLEHAVVFEEESASYDMPQTNFGVSINILGATLDAFGTHEQKLKHLPNILSGRELWIQFLSEPSGGSDLAGLLTNAKPDGDTYVVNGQKTWSSSAYLSDFGMCPVRTRWDVPKHKGISILIVDLRSPGIELRRIQQIDGGAEFCEEFFTDLVVPVSNLIGEENQGWRVARGMLEIEHAWVGRGGSAPKKPDESGGLTDLAKSRGLEHDPGVRRRIVGFHVATTAQKLVSARVSDGMARGKLTHGYGSLLSLGDSQVLQRRAEFALALEGGRGVAWSKEDPAGGTRAQQFLNSRRLSIAGGTNEIQRNNVSERVLGLPREVAADRDVPFNQIPHN